MDAAQYEAYMKDMLGLIAKATPSDFNPSLNALDAVVQSVAAAPTAQLKGPGPAAACPGGMAARLAKSARARVTFTDGTPLRIRNKAGKGGTILGTIPEGGTMVVLDGPQCDADGAWWQVKVESGGKTGWVLEGEKGVYYVEPWK
jgi:uncharacterized protein YgiM (DUF1202 family)